MIDVVSERFAEDSKVPAPSLTTTRSKISGVRYDRPSLQGAIAAMEVMKRQSLFGNSLYYAWIG